VSQNNEKKKKPKPKKIIGSVPDKHKVGKLVFFWDNEAKITGAGVRKTSHVQW
jgi:hypothetical protein